MKLAYVGALALGLSPIAAHAQLQGQDWSTDFVTDGTGTRTLAIISAEERNAFSTANAALPKAGGTLTGAVSGTSLSLSGQIQAATLSLTTSQTASYALIAPAGGGAPTFRQITSSDISGLTSGTSLLNISPMTAAFTFSTSDANGYNECQNTLVTDTVTGTAGHNDTIPLGLPQGCRLRLSQLGSDPVTVVGVSGVTILSPGGTKLSGQNTSLNAVVLSASNGSAETVLLSSGI